MSSMYSKLWLIHKINHKLQKLTTQELAFLNFNIAKEMLEKENVFSKKANVWAQEIHEFEEKEDTFLKSTPV